MKQALPLEPADQRAVAGAVPLRRARTKSRSKVAASSSCIQSAKLATIVHTPGEEDGAIDLLAPQAGYILTRSARRSGRAGDDIVKLVGEARSVKAKQGALED